MPRPTLTAATEFTETLAFHAFLDALCLDGVISLSRSYRFWGANNRRLQDHIYRLLTDIARRSNLPDGEPNQLKLTWPIRGDGLPDETYDYDDPDWIADFGKSEDRPKLKRDGLFAMRVFALLPRTLVGDEPLLKCHAADVDWLSLAKRLRARIPAQGIIRAIRVFFCAASIRGNNYFPNFSWPRWPGWEGIPFPQTPQEFSSNFSKRVLREFYGDAETTSHVELDHEDLERILGTETFLTSDNIYLFIGEIRDRLPKKNGWQVQRCNSIADAGSIAGGPAHAIYQNEQGETVSVIFTGCLNEAQLQQQFSGQELGQVEFW